MTSRIQEAGKDGVIHRQMRVLTRGACCDQLVATYDIHTCEYIYSHSLPLSLSFAHTLVVIITVTLIIIYFLLLFTIFLNYYFFKL